MKNIILTLFFLIGIGINAQNKSYLTSSQNLLWIDNLKNLQLNSAKIDLIKAKIYSDTLYEKRIIMDNPRDPEKHICQTLFVIVYENKYYKIDLRDNRKLFSIMKFINEKNITEIKILNYPETVVLFGDYGVCGVVTIYSNKKLGQKLRNVL